MNNLRVLLLLVTAFVLSAAAQTDDSKALKGMVVDADGHPISGVEVQQYRYRMNAALYGRADMEESQLATTGADGAFEFKAAPDTATYAPAVLVARKQGLAPAWKQVTPAVRKDDRIVMVAPSFMSGTVVDEADKPIAGAEVFVAVAFSELQQEGSRRSFNYLSDKPARDCFSTKTGADGKFRIDNFPTNAVASLSAKVSGKALRPTEQMRGFGPDNMPHHPGQENIRLVMETTGTIEGKVVAEEPGQKLPTARIMLMPDGPGMFSRMPSEDDVAGQDGTFRIKDVPAGSYRLQTIFGTNMPSEWVAETVQATVDGGQTKGGVTITAIRGGLLEMSVVGKVDHKPLSQVNVSVYRQEFQGGSLSGSNGVALLRLPPGDYQVSAYKEGWRGDNSSASIEAGKTNHVDLELSPPVKIKAIVRRPDGQPGANLPVRIVGDYSSEEANLKTTAEGKFESDWNVQAPRGDGMMPCLLIRDTEHNLAVAQDLDEDAGQLDLRLAPGLTLAGRVESEGKPLTNAAAALVFWTGNSGMHIAGLNVLTNAPGKFEIPALPVGRKYGLYVSAPGYSQKYVNLPENETEAKRIDVDTVELRMAKLKLAGKVVDNDDKPVAGAYVHVSGEDQPNENVRTDNNGRFNFEHVCEGTVRLFANAGNSHGNVSAEGGETNVVLKLGENMAMGMVQNGKAQKIKGTVTAPDGKPVAGAQLDVFPTRMQRKVKTDTNGTYSLNFTVEPWQRQMGNPTLVVRDTVHNLAIAQEISEDSTNLDVQLKPALTIHGVVHEAGGSALTNAQVGLWMQAGRSTSQIGDQMMATDSKGAFTIAALPMEQDYTVFANAKGYGQKQLKVEVEWDTNRVDLEPLVLKLANQVLSGQVVNMNEKPVSGVHVSISGDGQPQSYMQSDSKGRFHFKVCEGQVQLFASGQNGWANATADAGDTNVILQIGQNDRSNRRAKPVSLKGKSLPELSSLGLTAEATPVGKPVLLCLLDIQQRPSRRVARLLTEQQEALRDKGITLVAIQAVVAGPDVVEEWKASNPILFPIGRLGEKAVKPQWISGIEALPWLILTDKEGKVAAEGFEFEELDNKIGELPK